MSKTNNKNNYLNRYTTLPFLLDMLYNKKLTLVDPTTWEDENDSYFMKLYKTKSKYKSILALCLAEYKYQDTEKYHIWKIYSGTSSGVCIQFFRDQLISYIETVPGIRCNKVTYKTIKNLNKEWENIKISELPFLKRKAFDGEAEFRIIYENDTEEIFLKDIPINLSSISKIILNPWMPNSLSESITKAINGIEGCNHIKVTQTNILNYEKWRNVGEKIVGLRK